MKVQRTCPACKKTFEHELVELVPGVPEDGYYEPDEFCPECGDEIEALGYNEGPPYADEMTDSDIYGVGLDATGE